MLTSWVQRLRCVARFETAYMNKVTQRTVCTQYLILKQNIIIYLNHCYSIFNISGCTTDNFYFPVINVIYFLEVSCKPKRKACISLHNIRMCFQIIYNALLCKFVISIFKTWTYLISHRFIFNETAIMTSLCRNRNNEKVPIFRLKADTTHQVKDVGPVVSTDVRRLANW